MDDILLLQAVERYMRGEMSSQEKAFFEDLRKSNPEVDQLVVEQTYLLNELNSHAALKAYKHSQYEVETKLAEEGLISKSQLKGKAKLVFMWKKYKRNIAVAASIAVLVSLVTTGLIISYNNRTKQSEISQLKRDLKEDIKRVISNINSDGPKAKPNSPETPKFGGTGFLIDGRGYLVTNAHVINKLKPIYVENNNGDLFNVVTVYTDPAADLAILKINDTAYKTINYLPYSIKKTGSDLGEQIFTLGYPRNEIVYGEGYLSAESGNEGDSTAYQISVSANPGNSGGPVINKNGEIIGIIKSKNSSADGVVYAAKSKNIFRLLDNLKKDGDTQTDIKLPTGNGLRGMERTLQVKKMKDFVYMVVSY